VKIDPYATPKRYLTPFRQEEGPGEEDLSRGKRRRSARTLAQFPSGRMADRKATTPIPAAERP